MGLLNTKCLTRQFILPNAVNSVMCVHVSVHVYMHVRVRILCMGLKERLGKKLRGKRRKEIVVALNVDFLCGESREST